MKKTTVEHSSGKYQVILAEGIFDNLPKILSEMSPGLPFYIVDQNVAKLHVSRVNKIIGQSNHYILPPGEGSKSYHFLKNIQKILFEKKYSRDSIIVSIGGGVTGDLAGFAAATYLRGIRIIHVPTTIIAACDSSIGGKTGINFQGAKNIIGAFHQPELVLIDPLFLRSLDNATYFSGIGELIKSAFLSGPDEVKDLEGNFNLIRNRDFSYLEKVIFKAVCFKSAVVGCDEMETSLRKILNLGHTFGHAFESVTRFKIPHGLAVQAGLIASLFLSARLGILNQRDLQDWLKLPLKIKVSPLLKNPQSSRIYGAMINDKKNVQGAIKLVLLSAPGKILIDISVPEKEIVGATDELKNLI
jgi:3-dehydroquinate synthase